MNDCIFELTSMNVMFKCKHKKKEDYPLLSREGHRNVKRACESDTLLQEAKSCSPM